MARSRRFAQRHERARKPLPGSSRPSWNPQHRLSSHRRILRIRITGLAGRTSPTSQAIFHQKSKSSSDAGRRARNDHTNVTGRSHERSLLPNMANRDRPGRCEIAEEGGRQPV